MDIIQKKRMLLNELLNLYNQYCFVKGDTAAKKTIESIIKGKEEQFVKLLEGEK